MAENGYGLFAVAVKAAENFIGFAGLTMARLEAPFTPAVEIGWRLAAASWGRGYATEAARACLAYGFSECGIREIVSFTARTNKRSMAVMERIGMTRNPDDDFEHPALPPGHPLRPHVLYRIGNPEELARGRRLTDLKQARLIHINAVRRIYSHWFNIAQCVRSLCNREY